MKINKFLSKSILIYFIVSVFSYASHAQLRGVYTVDPSKSSSSTNYTTIQAALTDLNTKGVNGPVSIEIADGSYTEALTIKAVKGTSDTSTIIITSASNDSSKVTINYTKSATSCVLYADGTKHLTIKNLGFNVIDQNGILFNKGSDSNIISNNCFIASTATLTSYTTGGFDISSYSLCKGLTIDNNYFLRNVNGISISSIGKVVIQNNVFDSVDKVIHVNSTGDVKITNNKMIAYNYFGGCWGIYLESATSKSIVEKNIISLVANGNGMYLKNFSALVANNFISIDGSDAYLEATGILVQKADSGIICFNNINIFDSADYGKGIKSDSVVNKLNIYNNCISVRTRNGYDIEANTGSISKCDYNNLYSYSSNIGNYKGTTVAGISNWTKTTKFDSNSISEKPVYTSNTDLHTLNRDFIRAAKSIPTITDDIDGDKRKTPRPDIGADELPGFYNDIAAVLLDSPSVPVCAGTKGVLVKIQNVGLNSLTNAKIHWSINGIAQKTYVFSGSLSFGATSSIKLGTHTFLPNTYYTYKIYADSPNAVLDSNHVNDTISGKIYTAMSGSFTIGGSSSNYPDIRTSITALNESGVCGRVIFNVKDSTYSQSLVFDYIRGTSAANTVNYQSASGDSTKVILNTPADNGSSAPDFTLCLNGAQYLNFKKMTINRTGNGTYSSVVGLINRSNNDSFSNNIIKGIKSDNSNVRSRSVIFADTTKNNSNVFANNLVKNGTAGFYFSDYRGYNIPLTYQKNNLFLKNTCDSNSVYGFYLYNQYNQSVTGNFIHHLTYGGGAGIYLNTNYTPLINKNNIALQSSSNGIAVYNCIAASKSYPAYIANNFISLDSGSGIFATSSGYMSIVFNNILSTNPSTTQAALWTKDGNDVIYNNNLINKNKGLAIHLDSLYSLFDINYNNYFTNGVLLGLAGVSKAYSLAGWKKITSRDFYSLSVDPYFTSNTDLHTTSSFLNNKGQYFSSITDDFDGDTRSFTPDIGADEFTPATLDIAITGFVSPVPYTCAGTSDVILKLLNNGSDTIKYARVFWKADTTSHVYYFKGVLPPQKDTALKVGSFTYASGKKYVFIAGTDSPNRKTDLLRSNDTCAALPVAISMNGTFSIGGSGSDFSDFTDAVSSLNNFGVCGPVIFKVADSTYDEQIDLGNIPGSSAAYRITFQSASSDSTKVILENPSSSGSTNNFTLHLNGTRFVTFKNISIQRTGGNIYSTALSIENGAANDSFNGNCIIGYRQSNYSNADYSKSVSMIGDSNIVLYNNSILKGAYGVYLSDLTGNSIYNKVIHNSIDSCVFYGIYCESQIKHLIYDNKITGHSVGKTGIQGITLTLNNNGQTNKNYITIPEGGTGIYVARYGNSGKVSLDEIYNNFITVRGSSSYWTNYGIYTDDGFNVDILYNNVLVTYKGYCIYVHMYSGGTPTYTRIMNNNFINSGNGDAIGYNIRLAARSNFNNLLTNGTYLGEAGFTYCKTLSDFQTASNMDSSSYTLDPYFVSDYDLHVRNYLLHYRANYISNAGEDFDHTKRTIKNDFAGADIINNLFADDAAITSIDSPGISACAGTQNVNVTLRNYGWDTLKSAKIQWSVGGTLQTPLSWTGSIQPHDSLKAVSLGKFTFTGSTSYTIIAWTESPNGQTDSLPLNDTAYLIAVMNPLPSATVIAGQSICPYQKISIGAATVKGDIYSWISKPGGFTSSNSNPSVNPLVATTYYLTETTAAGCSKTDSVEINLKSKPTPLVSGTIELCNNLSASYKTNNNSGSSYLWNVYGGYALSGKGTDSIAIKWNNAGKDSVKVTETNSSGCMDSSVLKIIVDSIPIVKISGRSGICINGSISEKYFSGKSNNSYLWKLSSGKIISGNGTDSIIVLWDKTNSGLSQIFLAETSSKGCSDSSLLSVLIDSACVWPGDANADSIVTMKDLLFLGMGFGKSGYMRPNATIKWTPQACLNWNDTFLNSINYKHADCNGDSTINFMDTIAIKTNYSYHLPGPANQGLKGDPTLRILISKDSVLPGDTVTASILIGSATNTIKSILGASLSLNYNSTLVDTNYTSCDFSQCWMSKTPLHLSIGKAFRNYLDLGVSTINRRDTSGNGILATIKLKIIANLIPAKTWLKFSLSNNFQIDKNGNNIPVNLENDSVLILKKYTSASSMIDEKPMIDVYPNPANNFMTVRVTGFDAHEFYIEDIISKHTFYYYSNGSETIINTSDLSPGIYFLGIKGIQVSPVKICIFK